MKHLNSLLVSMLLISFCLAGCIEEDVEVQLVTLHLADHNPYPSANPTGIQTTQMVWDFMNRFTLEPENNPDSSPE